MFNGGRFLTDGCGVFVGLPQTEYPSIHTQFTVNHYNYVAS